jgi:hypothetical protein
MRKEEGATVAATYLLSGETVRAGFVRAEWAAILHGDYFTGKTHKIPQMSYLRTKRRQFSDNNLNKKKMQLSLRKQTKKHKECKNCFIAYF